MAWSVGVVCWTWRHTVDKSLTALTWSGDGNIDVLNVSWTTLSRITESEALRVFMIGLILSEASTENKRYFRAFQYRLVLSYLHAVHIHVFCNWHSDLSLEGSCRTFERQKQTMTKSFTSFVCRDATRKLKLLFYSAKCLKSGEKVFFTL